MKTLPTSNTRKDCLFNDFNYERMLNLHRHYSFSDNGSAIRVKSGGVNIPISKIVLLTDAKEVDHIDGNYLNFQINNLRPCTHQQNCINRVYKYKKRYKIKFRGVTRSGLYKFRAQIKVKGEPIIIGYYYTEEEAAGAYNIKAKELFGEFAILNKINEKY